jgi:hypothetical protein
MGVNYMISFIVVILLLCILFGICDIKSILKGNKNKYEYKYRNDKENSSNNIFPLKTQAQIDKELEEQERKNWKPNKKLFVTKEMKEQIFGN